MDGLPGIEVNELCMAWFSWSSYSISWLRQYAKPHPPCSFLMRSWERLRHRATQRLNASFGIWIFQSPTGRLRRAWQSEQDMELELRWNSTWKLSECDQILPQSSPVKSGDKGQSGCWDIGGSGIVDLRLSRSWGEAALTVGFRWAERPFRTWTSNTEIPILPPRSPNGITESLRHKSN